MLAVASTSGRGGGPDSSAEVLFGAKGSEAFLEHLDELVGKQLGRIRLETLGRDVHGDAALNVHGLVDTPD